MEAVRYERQKEIKRDQQKEIKRDTHEIKGQDFWGIRDRIGEDRMGMKM